MVPVCCTLYASRDYVVQHLERIDIGRQSRCSLLCSSVKRHRSRISRDNRHSPHNHHHSDHPGPRSIYSYLLFITSTLSTPISCTMFNAPRRPNGQSLSSSAFISSSTGNGGGGGVGGGSSYIDPLAQSTPNPSYGEVDPWSAVPSPARSGTPRRESQEAVRVGGGDGVVAGGREGLNAFFSESRKFARILRPIPIAAVV